MLNSPIAGGIAGGLVVLGLVYYAVHGSDSTKEHKHDVGKTLGDAGKEVKDQLHKGIEKVQPNRKQDQGRDSRDGK